MAKRKSENLACKTSQGEKAVKLGPYQQKGVCDDEVVLRFDDDRELYASAAFLRLISPVFKAMLEHNFREKETGLVKLKEKNYEDFRDFLLLCSSADYKPVDEISVFKLLPYAEEYQVRLAIDACKYVMLSVIYDYSHVDYTQLKTRISHTMFVSSVCETLTNLLSFLSLCSKFSYVSLVEKIVAIVSYFPDDMYIRGKDPCPKYLRYLEECEPIYKSVTDSAKVVLLEARMVKSR